MPPQGSTRIGASVRQIPPPLKCVLSQSASRKLRGVGDRRSVETTRRAILWDCFLWTYSRILGARQSGEQAPEKARQVFRVCLPTPFVHPVQESL